MASIKSGLAALRDFDAAFGRFGVKTENPPFWGHVGFHPLRTFGRQEMGAAVQPECLMISHAWKLMTSSARSNTPRFARIIQ